MEEELHNKIDRLIYVCLAIIVVQMVSCSYITKDHDIITAAIWKNGFQIKQKCGP